jgi:ribose 5-phosphate isomerase B
MKIAIGCDHAGHELKDQIKKWLTDEGHEVADKGTNGPDSVDYPDFAHAVAEDVESGKAELGFLVCGSGNGVCITANKHKGIRAALAWQPDIAALARQHNNANVLCLPARFISQQQAHDIVDAYLKAEFEGGRHQRRVDKISC